MDPIVDDDFENITSASIPITLSEGWNMDDNEVVYVEWRKVAYEEVHYTKRFKK